MNSPSFRPESSEIHRRSILSFVVVPLALISGLLVPLSSHWSAGRDGKRVDALGAPNISAVLTRLPPGRSSVRSRLSEEEALILFGSSAGEGNKDRWRRFLEARLDDPVFLGAYVSEVMSSREDGEQDVYREARKREPENARYDWLLAWTLCRQAATLESPRRAGFLAEEDEAEEKQALVVRDRESLDEAMSLVLSGTQKPVFRTYAKEMLDRQMDIFGRPRNVVESIERVSVAAGLLLPDVGALRGLTKHTLAYARLLASEGKHEEAARYARLWQDLAEGLQEDSFTLIHVLVVAAVAGLAEEQAPPILDEAGFEEAAERNRAYAAALAAPVRAWKDRMRDVPRRRIEKRAGIMDSMLLPAIGEEIDDSELRAGRLLDYHLVDTAAITHLPFAAALLLVLFWLIGLRWRVAGQRPLLLAPPYPEQLRILLAGFFLPAAAWLALTRFPPIGLRDYALTFTLSRAPAQLLVTAVIMVGVTGWLATKTARNRCEAAGIPVPQTRGWPTKVLAGLVAAAAVLAFFPAWEGAQWLVSSAPTAALAVLGVALLTGNIVGGVALRTALADRQHGTYHGTVARSVLPSYAFFTLLLVWLPIIPLQQREMSLVRNATWGAKAQGFTTIEDRATNKLLEKMQEATALREAAH